MCSTERLIQKYKKKWLYTSKHWYMLTEEVVVHLQILIYADNLLRRGIMYHKKYRCQFQAESVGWYGNDFRKNQNHEASPFYGTTNKVVQYWAFLSRYSNIYKFQKLQNYIQKIIKLKKIAWVQPNIGLSLISFFKYDILEDNFYNLTWSMVLIPKKKNCICIFKTNNCIEYFELLRFR